MRKTLFLSLLTALLFSCHDRKVYIVDGHTKGHNDGFLLKASRSGEDEDVFVGQAVEIHAEIRYKSHAYSSSFHLTQKSSRRGMFRNATGDLIADWRTEKDGLTPVRFTPLEKGSYKLVFRASDDFGEVRRDSLRFEAKGPPFKVSVAKQQTRIAFKRLSSIELQIQNKTSNLPKTFTYESDLKGVLTYDKRPYEEGESIPIGTKTDISLQFTPEAIGIGKLKFVFRDEFGQAHSLETKPITVYRIPFTLKTDYKKTPVYVNEKGAVVLGIRDDNKVVSPKKMTFESSESFAQQKPSSTSAMKNRLLSDFSFISLLFSV